MFEGKSILITGGTGTIGKYLVKQLCESNPKRIVVFSRDEDKQFKMKHNIASNIVDYVIGDIRDKKRLDDVMIGIDFVLHTAAMKQVPIAEENPYEATMTNIIGTYNVVQSAQQNNVNKLIIFSSDKAVSPSNCMGMSKGISERIARTYHNSDKTIITIIRLGNVIGSRGSVLTVWKSQIKNNRQITLTSEKMTRFIMSLADVFRLVVHALQYGKNGEILLYNMCSCRIADLAKLVCKENNLDWEKDVKIVGMRKGEKEYEEIYSDEEGNRIYKKADFLHISTTDVSKGFSTNISQKSNSATLLNIEQLNQWIAKNNILLR